MSYSQGGKIDAADYNNFLNGSNQLNTVWATGTGNAGYGQTALSTVSQTGIVTATQWATLINTLNNILTHQSGSGSGISATTAGAKIDYLSTLATSINTGYTNRLNRATVGSTVAGSAFSTVWSNASTSATLTNTVGARCAFGSADQARYFFNAGGSLKFNVSATQNASTTARTNDIISMAGFLGGVNAFAQGGNGGRSGTGGTLNTNDTAKGYWTTTKATNTTLVAITSTTAAYTSDTASIYVNLNGAAGANGDNGINVDFYVTYSSTSGTNLPAPGYSFNDSIGVNLIRSIDITYPESTYLSNSWGTPTISAL